MFRVGEAKAIYTSELALEQLREYHEREVFGNACRHRISKISDRVAILQAGNSGRNGNCQ